MIDENAILVRVDEVHGHIHRQVDGLIDLGEISAADRYYMLLIARQIGKHIVARIDLNAHDLAHLAAYFLFKQPLGRYIHVDLALDLNADVLRDQAGIILHYQSRADQRRERTLVLLLLRLLVNVIDGEIVNMNQTMVKHL